jgi:hypothetical protein
MWNSAGLFDGEDAAAPAFAALGTVRAVAGTTVTVEVGQAGGASALVSAPAVHLVNYGAGDRVLLLFQSADPASAVVAGRIDRLADVVDGTQFLRADGATPLTADWDTGASGMIRTQEVRARDASGLQIGDESGLLGIFVDDGGNVGIGTTAPQGHLHLWDGIGGHLNLSRTAIGAAAQILLPAGTVTALARLDAIVSNGSVRGYVGFSLVVGGTTSQNLVTGSDTWQFRLNANGSVDVRRTAGSGSATAYVRAMWM